MLGSEADVWLAAVSKVQIESGPDGLKNTRRFCGLPSGRSPK